MEKNRFVYARSHECGSMPNTPPRLVKLFPEPYNYSNSNDKNNNKINK